MPLPSCTIDSSVVIALSHVGESPKLVFLYSRVLLAKAVRKELFRRRATKDQLQALLRDHAFLTPCEDYDPLAVDLLLAEHARRGSRDRGEAEAILQASQFGAAVLVDDRWGRRLAGRFGLDHHGTVWVLERLHELDLLQAAEMRAEFLALRKRGVRLPWQEVNELLQRRGQERLAPD